MSKTFSAKALIGGASIIAMMTATPAFAQIDEIIVTAEKRAENVQDVGISVTAFSEKTLELGGIDDVSRLELLTPGGNFAFAGNETEAAFVPTRQPRESLDQGDVKLGVHQARTLGQSRQSVKRAFGFK